MSHKSTAPGIPYRVKPRFKRSPCAGANPLDAARRYPYNPALAARDRVRGWVAQMVRAVDS